MLARRTVLALTLAAIAAAPTVGCSTSAEVSPAQTPAAMASPAAAATATGTPSPSTSAPTVVAYAVGTKVSMRELTRETAEAAAHVPTFQFVNRSVTGGQTIEASGRVHRDAGGFSVEESYTMSGKHMRMIITPGAAYWDMSALTSHPPARWVRVSLTATDPLARQLAPMLKAMQTAATNPGAVPVAPTAVAVATAHGTQGGVPTTTFRFSGRVTRQEAVFFLPKGTPMNDQVLRLLVGSTYEGELVRSDATGLTLSQKTVTHLRGGLSATTEMTYSHWGEPVTVTPPGPDDYVDSSQVR